MSASFITLGLAELASAFPSSGGQYHFAFMVSPARHRAVIAYFTGWLSVFAWLFMTASATIFCAQLCVSLAQLYHEDYVATQWQTWLIYTGIMLLCCAIVCLLPRLIPMLESMFFWCSLVGFAASVITMLATSDTKQSAKKVFVDWSNLTGWGDGTAFMLAVGQSMWGFSCTDSATHLSEEVHNPGRTIPRAMWLTMVIGISTVIPFTLAMLFSVNDYDALAASSFPITEVYFQATSNRSAAAVFTALILFIYFGAQIGLLVTTGRLIWAFGRDNGMPSPRWFAKTHATLKTPVNATIFATVFCILYGLIYIGSTAAFNTFVATSVLALNISYVIPQGVALVQGRDLVVPERAFNLGRIFGTFVNLYACAWIALYSVLFCFPIFLPVTVQSMNYVSVVIVGTILFISIMWFTQGRKVFTGPNVQFQTLDATELDIQAKGSDGTVASETNVGKSTKNVQPEVSAI